MQGQQPDFTACLALDSLCSGGLPVSRTKVTIFLGPKVLLVQQVPTTLPSVLATSIVTFRVTPISQHVPDAFEGAQSTPLAFQQAIDS